MDPDELDQTQAIFLDEPSEDDGTDELEKEPKSFLKVLFQRGFTEKSYPLYEGDNVIGRNADTCHVCIPSKSLSKEHACIQITKDSHLIYDKGSRNKTKRGKLFLSPEVRYELKSNDEISFADIKCVFLVKDADCMISDADGSETENSDSLLQPTQTFAKETAMNPAIVIQETPERENSKHLSTVVLSESESEDEDGKTNRQTRTSNTHGRQSLTGTVLCEDSDPESSVDSEKFSMATQAYFSDSNKDKGRNEVKDVTVINHSDEPTQVCHIEEATQACHSDEPTQAFLQKNEDHCAVSKKDDSSATQSSHTTDDVRNRSTDGTQSFDINCKIKEGRPVDHDDPVLKSTQVFEDEDEDSEDETCLFAVATMAPDDFMEEDEDQSYAEICEPDVLSTNDAKSVIPVNNDSTLPVSTVSNKQTLKFRSDSSELPTQVVDETLKTVELTENNNVEPSSKISKYEDATQEFGETAPVSDTVDVDEAKAVKKSVLFKTQEVNERSSKRKKKELEEAATLVFETDEICSDSEESDIIISEEKANDLQVTETQAYGGINETETQLYGNGKDVENKHVNTEGPTQAYGAVDDMDTQPYGDEDSNSEHGDRQACFPEEPTQAYGLAPDVETQFYEDIDTSTKNHGNDLPICNTEDATQAYSTILEDATQVFTEIEAGSNCKTMTKTIPIEPTQKINCPETVLLDEPTQEINCPETVPIDEPTQKINCPENDKLPQANSNMAEEDSVSDDDSDLEEKSVLRTDHMLDNEITQVLDMNPETMNEEVQPTLQYNMELEEKDSCKDKKDDATKREQDTHNAQESKNQQEKNLDKDGNSTSSNQKSNMAADNECYSYPLSPCLEDIGDSEETAFETCDKNVTIIQKSPPHPLPSRSPLKPTLVDRKRSPSPSPKRVAFKETADEYPHQENEISGRQRRSSRTVISAKDKNCDDSSTSKTGRRKSALRKNEALDSNDMTNTTETTVLENKSDMVLITASKRGRRGKGANATDKQEQAKESNIDLSTEIPQKQEKNENSDSSTSKTGRRKSALKKTEAVDSNDTTNVTETTVSEEKSDVILIAASKRGRRGKGANAKEEQEQVKESSSDLSTEIPEKQEKNSELVTKQEQDNGTPSKLKNTRSKGASDSVTKAKRHSKTDEQSINYENDGKLSESSERLNDQNSEDSKKERHTSSEDKDETKEQLEAENSTSRRGRRITKTSRFKDFETSGTNKRENLSKQIKTRPRTASDSGSRDKNAIKSTETQKRDVDTLPEDPASPIVPPATKRRKKDDSIGKKDAVNENQSEFIKEEDETVDLSKRSTRGRKTKVNETKPEEKAESDKASRTMSDKDQIGKSGRSKTRASFKAEVDESLSEKNKNTEDNPTNFTSTLDNDSETSTTKKGSGKRGSMAKAQKKDTTAKTRQKLGKVSGEVNVEETLADDKISKKVSDKGSPQMTKVSAARRRHGAASAALVNELKDESPKNVDSKPHKQEVRDTNPSRGKRKKTSPEEENEISSTPTKRLKSTILDTSTQASSSPALRRSTIEHKPKVMFTGVIDEQGEKTIKELGGELATSIQDCTHLVTDRVRRTVKFLGGLAKGALIVSQQWLDGSKRAGTFLDGHKYLVKDKDVEKQFKFSLVNSLATANRQPLLSGFHIHVSKSVKPDANQMKDILQCAGAEFLPKMPTKAVDNTVVISCPGDEKLCKPALKLGISVVTAEFILTGILRQEIDINAYRLFQ